MEEQREINLSLATTMLYEATLKDDVNSLLNLLQEDPLILDRCTTERSSPFMKSPLHISAKLGHVNFTQKILDLNPSMCFARDQEGMTPVHVAAINGRSGVLKVFLRERPEAAWECTMVGETVLHLCVKNRQLTALKSLDDLTDDGELLNSENSRGDTALHLAIASKQTEMVQFLLALPKIQKNCMNKKGRTAVDTLMQSRPDSEAYKTILNSLKCAKAKLAKDVLNARADNDWLEEQRTSLMVVASLIATMAFQAGINPPGGEDAPTFVVLLVANTTALISSLTVILFLISGLPSNRFVLFILRVILWVAVTAIAITYFIAVIMLTYSTALSDAFHISVFIWMGFMGIIFVGHLVRFIVNRIGWQTRNSFKRWFTKLQIKKLWNW